MNAKPRATSKQYKPHQSPTSIFPRHKSLFVCSTHSEGEAVATPNLRTTIHIPSSSPIPVLPDCHLGLQLGLQLGNQYPKTFFAFVLVTN
jgi:hypothetical protein